MRPKNLRQWSYCKFVRYVRTVSWNEMCCFIFSCASHVSKTLYNIFYIEVENTFEKYRVFRFQLGPPNVKLPKITHLPVRFRMVLIKGFSKKRIQFTTIQFNTDGWVLLTVPGGYLDQLLRPVTKRKMHHFVSNWESEI